MTVEVKICGLDRPETVDGAVNAGAEMLGFVFYPPSPRNLTASAASRLTNRVPAGVKRVGLFVDPTDEMITTVLNQNVLDLIQLHGNEPPERVAEIKDITSLKVIKVLKVTDIQDLKYVSVYQRVAEWLMFDALAPKDMKGALPGGNALSFDWNILARANIPTPWILAGGLNLENVKEAISTSGAKVVDVSSGVEKQPGVKCVEKIQSFIRAVKEA
ncbi:MAG TPA: phosphoribosylanthranilate isomerase [Rhodospirillales bacterium]|nr:phosphoribosylanthranilate isomerase [Rhodospirillales bacterium]